MYIVCGMKIKTLKNKENFKLILKESASIFNL